MSYDKAMKWHKKHIKGTRMIGSGPAANIGFSTGSGFWPSQSFLSEDYYPYLEECKKNNVIPVSCENYYKAQLRR